MLPVFQLLKFKGSEKCIRSHSMPADFTQIHVRNVFLFWFALSISRQIYVDSINCQLAGNNVRQSYVDTTCFINGTETYHHTLNVVSHNYYQWIPVILLLQAYCFYFPFHVWSNLFNYYLKEITTDISTPEDVKRVQQVIVSSKGNDLFLKTWGLELVYMLHWVSQIVLLDYFFNHVLYRVSWSPLAISILFPYKTTCFTPHYSGGDQTLGRYVCLLPLSSVYQKIFSLMYGLFVGLLLLYMCFCMYRVYLMFRIGNKHIHMWWSFEVAKSESQTWQAKRLFHQMSKDIFCQRKKEQIESEQVLMQTC